MSDVARGLISLWQSFWCPRTMPFWTAPLATTSTISPTLYCLRYVPRAIIPFFLKSREKAGPNVSEMLLFHSIQFRSYATPSPISAVVPPRILLTIASARTETSGVTHCECVCRLLTVRRRFEIFFRERLGVRQKIMCFCGILVNASSCATCISTTYLFLRTWLEFDVLRRGDFGI